MGNRLGARAAGRAPGRPCVAGLLLAALAAAPSPAQESRGEWEIEPEFHRKSGDIVPYEVVDDAIPRPLVAGPGDPVRGQAIAIDRGEGNCLACHSMPIPEEPFHGDLGPDLRGVANRMTAGQLRLRIVNPKIVEPKTLMPAYYVTEGLYRVREDFAGAPILEAEDIEDLVSFLRTLTR